MTFKEFKTLDSEKREIICWSRGRKVAERYDDDYDYMLYHLDSFYIEIRFSKTNEIILDFYAFENTDELYPYLLSIDISEIIGSV